MLKEIRLGEYNLLRVKEEALREGFGEVFGMYLDAGREGEILMPQKYVPEGTKPGDEIECFVYLDQDERPIATTEKPLALVGDFAYLTCSWVNEYGAFLNWGLTKDIFCPFREQKKRMEIGDSFIVHIHIDEDSYRIVASAKIEHYLKEIDDGGISARVSPTCNLTDLYNYSQRSAYVGFPCNGFAFRRSLRCTSDTYSLHMHRISS